MATNDTRKGPPLAYRADALRSRVEGLLTSPSAVLLPKEAREVIRELAALVFELAVTQENHQ